MGSLLRRIPAFRRSYQSVDDYAKAWAEHNARSLAGEGPLWVVLGDSAAQGVGASSYDRGWVGLVHRRVLTGHRLLNLSRSGARTRDVVDVQWPEASAASPALVTVVVGGNDAVHTPLAVWLHDIDHLTAALPAGSVVATVSRGVFERKTRRANDRLRSRAAVHHLRVADIWAATGPPYRGLYADGFHPNDRGYLAWADAVAQALAVAPP